MTASPATKPSLSDPKVTRIATDALAGDRVFRAALARVMARKPRRDDTEFVAYATYGALATARALVK